MKDLEQQKELEKNMKKQYLREKEYRKNTNLLHEDMRKA